MEVEDLKQITLNTTLYHLFLGSGNPTAIFENIVRVRFSESVETEFVTLGTVGGNERFIEELFLYPVEIVKK